MVLHQSPSSWEHKRSEGNGSANEGLNHVTGHVRGGESLKQDFESSSLLSNDAHFPAVLTGGKGFIVISLVRNLFENSRFFLLLKNSWF